MIFNLKKKALLPLDLEEIILPDIGVEETEFGQYQPMVDLKWEAGGNRAFTNKKEMVDSYGGIEAMQSQINTVKENPESSRNLINTVETIKNFSTKLINVKKGKGKNKMIKPFNLKKAQYENPEGQPAAMPGFGDSLNDTPELGEEQFEWQQDNDVSRKFKDGKDVQLWLEGEPSIGNAIQLIVQNDDSGSADLVKEMIEQFYDMLGEPSTEPRDKEVVAGQIFDYLPASLKEETGVISQKRVFEEVNSIIKKLAEKIVKKNKKKPFNLIKTAQHKTLNNVIVWGPQETRQVDPFSRQPISDWHIIERNKGFGLVVDDVWDIDYEAIWRGNIMDKFSRPYKNKDGQWVGGYLNKRFEIDYNVPETNDYQLKPGQLRRPILPQYGIIESRMQEARSKGEVVGGPVVSREKPFNWKEAQSKKKS